MARILIVEDLPSLARLTASLLRQFGHSVAVAGDGEAALQVLATGVAVDLVLLDLELPRVDGLEVLRAARRDLRLRVPVVMYSACDDGPTRARAHELGAAAWLVKGQTDWHELAAAVARHATPAWDPSVAA